MNKYIERLGPLVQPDQIDEYMKWLKDNPSVLLTSSNDIVSDGVTFTCGQCHSTEKINDEEMNSPCTLTEWECKICTGDSSKRIGRVHTMMMRLN